MSGTQRQQDVISVSRESSRSLIPWTKQYPPLLVSDLHHSIGTSADDFKVTHGPCHTRRVSRVHCPTPLLRTPMSSGRSLWRVILSSDSMRAPASLDATNLDFRFSRCHFRRRSLCRTSTVFDQNGPWGTTNLKFGPRYKMNTSHVP